MAQGGGGGHPRWSRGAFAIKARANQTRGAPCAICAPHRGRACTPCARSIACATAGPQFAERVPL